MKKPLLALSLVAVLGIPACAFEDRPGESNREPAVVVEDRSDCDLGDIVERDVDCGFAPKAKKSTRPSSKASARPRATTAPRRETRPAPKRTERQAPRREAPKAVAPKAPAKKS